MSIQKTFAAAVTALLFAAPLSAQRMSPTALAPVPANIAAPTYVHAAVTVVAVADSTQLPVMNTPPVIVSAEPTFYTGNVFTTAPTVAPIPAPEHGGRNGALMIIGGATLVVGSIIGGDAGTLMMVGGGVVGLVGLWRYLQ